MRNFKLVRVIVASMAAFFMAMVTLAPSVQAVTVNKQHPNLLIDNFSTFEYRTAYDVNRMFWDPTFPTDEFFASLTDTTQPYWWTITGELYYNYECSPMQTECVTHEVENGNGFVRMTVKPYVQTQEWPEYHESGITEGNHGFTYSMPRRWEPTPGHPVTMISKMRWSEAYNADGSGEFIGSSGIYLWNMPADYTTMQFHGPKAIGISLVSDDSESALSTGLGVDIVNVAEPAPGEFPLYSPESVNRMIYDNVNIHDWVEFKMVWSENKSGVQSVAFWINGDFVGKRTLAEALPSLAVEMWNDNYVLVPVGEGLFMASSAPYTVQQDYEVDFVKVMQK